MTKYTEMLKRFNKNRNQFDDYEKETHQLVSSIKTALIRYLDCTEDRIEWLQFSLDEPESSWKAKGVIEFSADRRMSLHNDGFYGFKFRIYLYDPDVIAIGGNRLDLSLFIKKVNSEFTIKVGKEIRKIDDKNIEGFVEYIVSMIEEFLDTEFNSFVQGGEKKHIGFITTT